MQVAAVVNLFLNQTVRNYTENDVLQVNTQHSCGKFCKEKSHAKFQTYLRVDKSFCSWWGNLTIDAGRPIKILNYEFGGCRV